MAPTLPVRGVSQVTNGATSAGARDQRRCQDRGPPLASCPLPRPPPSAVAGHVGPQAQGPRHRRLDLDAWPGPGGLAARNSTPITRLSLLGGRPRDLFSEMIAPWVKISPPQTPCGSWRSTAPARQNRRIGQGWQYALASSRSAGRSENQARPHPLTGVRRPHPISSGTGCPARTLRWPTRPSPNGWMPRSDTIAWNLARTIPACPGPPVNVGIRCT